MSINIQNKQKNVKQRLFEVVSSIPPGKVAYYGQVAAEVGIIARTAGWMLSGMNDEEMEKVPWQRVVAKNGFISAIKLGYRGEIQKDLLISEGVEVVNDYVNMDKYCLDSFEKIDSNQDN
jgi:methylated-DNA-protein-cysteine methyltransferase-like protein